MIADELMRRLISGELTDYNVVRTRPELLRLTSTNAPKPTPHKKFVQLLLLESSTYRNFIVFAADSIEMGAAVQWLPKMAAIRAHFSITACNVRRGY
jgi:hypothetical protein